MRAARSATALLCTAALAAGVVGCGGSELDYQEVPGPPVEVAIPSETVEAGASGDADADADATPTPTATAEPGSTTAPSDQSGATDTAPSTGTDTASSGTSDTDSGGATAPAQEDSATNDTAPPAGSEAQQFEDFCAQNPGAC
jgi:hypothetical protein